MRRTEVLIPFLLTAGFFIYWLLDKYLFHDLVWDELVSLTNFVLVDIKTTVTHYPDVNNHVFFNLLNNIYCKVIGIPSIYEAMDRIVAVRFYPLVITLLSLMYVFLTGKKFFNTTVGFMAVILLATTLPFLNFTMQLRGYSLSMTLMAGAIYHAWSIERDQKLFDYIMLSLITFMFLYTIPSNVYFSLALAAIYVVKWIRNGLKKGKESAGSTLKNWTGHYSFYVLVAIGLGAVASYGAYTPIIEDILTERHITKFEGQSHYMHNLQDTFPFVVHYIFSYRYLLVIPLLLVAAFAYRKFRKKDVGWTSYATGFLIGLILISFLIAFFRNDRPPQRTFLPLTVVFSLLSAIAIGHVSKQWGKTMSKPLPVFLVAFVYCVASYFFCDYLRQSELRKAIINGDKVYNMFYNFYQSDLYGSKYIDPLIEDAKSTGYPIILAKEIDRVFEGEYIMKNGLKYYSTVWSKRAAAENEVGFQYRTLLEISNGKGNRPKYMPVNYPPTIEKQAGMFVPLFNYLYQTKVIDNQDPKFYVMTAAPRWFEGVMRENLKQLKYTRINKRMTSHNIYLVTR